MAGMARYMSSQFGGRCFVCHNRYQQGEEIWYEPAGTNGIVRSRACHSACRRHHAAVSGPREYVFANRDQSSLFDRLIFDDPKDMLVRAFELSAEHNEPCSVARNDDNKLVPMMMISVVPGVSLTPAPPAPEEDKPTEGPLFEWPAGAKPPF
jgi:hypothetical protein